MTSRRQVNITLPLTDPFTHMTNHQIHEVTPEAWAKQQKQKTQPLAA